MSVVSVRGGIQGNEGVIGEDGAVEGGDDDESSVDGMRTRQSKNRYRKKMSQDKSDVLARTRQAVAAGAAVSTGKEQGGAQAQSSSA